MKKTGLFKIILCIIAVVAASSWFLSLNYFSQGQLVALPEQYQAVIGIFDVFQTIFATITYFSDKFIFILSVGAFYGVLAKTGKYRAWVDKIAETFKGREKTIAIIIMVILALLSSMFNYGLLLFMFIPLLIGVIITMGFDKITAFVLTFGSILIGEFGSTFGSNVSAALNEGLGTTFTTGIFYKIALLLIGIGFLVVYILKSNIDRKTNAKDLDSLVGEKNSNKYSVVHLFIIFGILLLILIVGCTVWSNYFTNDIFTNFHNKLMDTTIGGNNIFYKLNGTFFNTLYIQNSNTSFEAVKALGTWSYFEMSIVLLLLSLIVGRLYKMNHKNILNCMAEGAKKLMVPSLLLIFAYTVLLESQYLFPAVANYILNITSKFNVFFSSLTAVLASIFSVDAPYILLNAPQIAAHGGNTTVVMLLVQGIYGIMMLVAPTSTMLILGLSYLEIPYTEYIKKVWKYVLSLLAVLMFILLLLAFILK